MLCYFGCKYNAMYIPGWTLLACSECIAERAVRSTVHQRRAGLVRANGHRPRSIAAVVRSGPSTAFTEDVTG